MEVAISRDIRGGEETHRSPHQVDRLFSSVSSPSRTIPKTRCDDSATTTEEVLSTSSSVRAPTSTPDTTAVSSRSSSVELQTPQSMFKKYRTLPFVKSTAIRIYPDATGQITPAHWDRFYEIARMFQKAVEEHETLRHYAQGVGYLLKQCGTSPSKSCPSIVVTCTKEVCRALGKLLVRPDLKEQYDPPSPQRRRKLFNSQQKSHPTQDKPRFQIYLWIQEGPLPFTLLWRRRVAEGLQIEPLHDTDSLPWSDLTMCSSRVTYSDGSCTTLSCLLEVDSKVYGLTVGHAFAHLMKDPQRADDTKPESNHAPNMLDEGQSSPAGEHFNFTVNDVEYEISEDDSTPRAPATPRPTSAPISTFLPTTRRNP
ncbi:hypothetical protein ASPVEDRAFT_402672 [Aspergillus versicolor CBS 583.65]|uniref:Uncharacterized protein n=1 Tax=Aspergillus versicolor CBS 583.65 TaxID=1036611 RepID=A0A1L9Q445_ASPVE|nr:uncharacterized protein ASPVEDRAFT_402672 [Aspergillus versicolor CBS 583.65]OJJ08553.1 hypothetical protein ASPVEDRAFT_402672 [Aspergillus versicolor CBS 583.65]